MNQSIVRIKLLSFTRIQGCFKVFFLLAPSQIQQYNYMIPKNGEK